VSNHTPEPQLRTHLYSINTVAERLDVSQDTVRRLIARGLIRSIRIGASVRVSAEELEAFVNSRRGNQT
jgi:excisionase family DNA binding protein